MAIWTVVFFPPSSNKYSPEDFVLSIDRKADIANIKLRLDTLSKLEIVNWPTGWIERYEKLYQLKAGDYRLYLGLDGRKIVVCHACRKVSMKAKRADIDRAKLNFQNYQWRTQNEN
jgi:hypothetical protein